jgi:nitrogen PTS system EIIA component
MHLNVRDVSRLLKVSEKKVHEWIGRGILRAERVNNRYLMHRSELLEQTSSRQIDVPGEVFADAELTGTQQFELAESLRAGGIFYQIEGADGRAALRAIIAALPLPAEADRELISDMLIAREALGSTAIGGGIAIPHVRRPLILGAATASISLFFLAHPVDFGAFDGKPVFAMFLLVSPSVRAHLHLLSRLSFALHDPGLKAALARRAPAAEILCEVERVEDTIRARAKLGSKS